MKKIFSIFLVLIIFINSFMPRYAFGAAAPEEPPEMPDWWRERYGDRQIENEEFKNKEIKTIKPPKKVSNPTPIGVAVGLTLEYLVSQNEDLQALHDDFWETVDKVDKEAARYLQENFGLSGWDDVFHAAKSGVVYVTEQFIEAFNSYFSMEHEYTDIDYDNILRLLDPNIKNYIDEYAKNYDSRYISHSIERVYYRYSEYYDTVFMMIQVIYDLGTWIHVREYSIRDYRYHIPEFDHYVGQLATIPVKDYDEAIKEAKEDARHYYEIEPNKTSRSKFLEYVSKYSGQDNLPKTYEVKNLGYLPNPFGARLSDPNNIEELSEYESGVIEIDNEKYHIINVPNPKHTPHLEPTNPNYIPTHYPIIRPIIPVPNSPNVDDPAHPANPNNPYSPNNPNPAEVPEIPLIPDITPSPSPQPSPDPSPDPSPEPSPDPSPEPSTPQIPRAPEDKFDEGKSCGELDLDLKSIDLFTTKFPFSIPWDILRALEAFFGEMGSEEPKFKLTFISEDTILELPEFIKEWVPFMRSIILFLFDIAVIYALYRWFGGAS